MVGKGQQVGAEECEVLDKLVGLLEEIAIECESKFCGKSFKNLDGLAKLCT